MIYKSVYILHKFHINMTNKEEKISEGHDNYLDVFVLQIH